MASSFASALRSTEAIASPLQRRAEKLLLLQRHTDLGHLELDEAKSFEAAAKTGLIKHYVVEPLDRCVAESSGVKRRVLLRAVLLSLGDDQRSTLEQKLNRLYDVLSKAACSSSFLLSLDVLGHWLRGLNAVFEALNEPCQEWQQSLSAFPSSQVDLVFFREALTSATDVSLGWLSALHRLVRSESVWQPVKCRGCKVHGFTGLRYESRLSPRLQWCRKCFWRGRVDAKHAADTFTEYVAPPQNVDNNDDDDDYDQSDEEQDQFDESAEYDANNDTVNNGVKAAALARGIGSNGSAVMPNDVASEPSSHSDSRLMVDEEHTRIAELSREVAAVERMERDRRRAEELETKNAALVAEIRRLRDRRQDEQPSVELGRLRMHRAELDGRLQELQQTRLALMTELEELIKVLKVCGQ